MEWEIVMGLEVHTELATKTKIFCGCSTEFGGAPNTHVCEICSGMPGTLPLLNERVVEFAVRTGLATNCQITQKTKFDRKNYFYPDLPKAYQISQLYLPICRNGYIEVKGENGEPKKSAFTKSIWKRTPASSFTTNLRTARWSTTTAAACRFGNRLRAGFPFG